MAKITRQKSWMDISKPIDKMFCFDNPVVIYDNDDPDMLRQRFDGIRKRVLIKNGFSLKYSSKNEFHAVSDSYSLIFKFKK